MKFTSEDLMKVMGLQVGDKVKTPKKMNEDIHNVIKARLDKEVVEEND